ncbi:MAG: GAF domain-containing protein [Desulfobacterales bacterium]|nr:MAG: GAF domain-containing protein [Desulfobacterales bacterium]
MPEIQTYGKPDPKIPWKANAFNLHALPDDGAPKLHTLFHHLGPDPQKNIDTIVATTSEMLQGACSLYNRLDEKAKSLCARAACNLPPDFETEKQPQGHICYEETFKRQDKPVVIEEIAQTPYAQTDPNVAKYGLRSYLGFPVFAGNRTIGSLCVLDKKKRTFSAEEIDIIATLAKAVALEEVRLQKDRELEKRLTYEKMLLDISTQALFGEDTGRFLHGCLKIMGQNLNTGSLCIWKYHSKTDTLRNISKWMAMPIPLPKHRLEQIPARTIPGSIERFKQNQVISFPARGSLMDGREKDRLPTKSVKSILMVPLFVENRFYGLIEFQDYQACRKWQDADIDILRTAAQMIAKSIEHKRLEESVTAHTASLSRTNKRLKEEILERTHMIKLLEKKEMDLAKRKREREQSNTGLKILSKKKDNDIFQLEERVLRNVKQLVEPSVRRLKASGLNYTQAKWLGILENNLDDITSPMVQRLSSHFHNLTPTEIKVAGFIKLDKTKKETAELLGLSYRTIEVHRSNIRKKLGIRNRKINLRTHLLSIQ